MACVSALVIPVYISTCGFAVVCVCVCVCVHAVWNSYSYSGAQVMFGSSEH